jgi:excisionase family DNA binding protein
MPKGYITTAEAAQLTGYNARHIQRLVREKKIKGIKWGIQWQVDRASLLAYVRTAEKHGAKRGPKTSA